MVESEIDLGYEKEREKKIVMREYLRNQERERIKFLLIASDVGCRCQRKL